MSKQTVTIKDMVLGCCISLASGMAFCNPFMAVAKEKNIDPHLLYSVAILESGRLSPSDKLVRPYPLAIHSGGAFYPSTKAKAIKILKSSLAKTDNIDVGMAQINWHYHGHRVENIAELLDTRKNLEIAADILLEAMATTSDRTLGVGRYHTGNTARARIYGERVLRLAEEIKNFGMFYGD